MTTATTLVLKSETNDIFLKGEPIVVIIGIGLDVIELERIEKAVKRNRKFVNRILTPLEREHYVKLSERRQIEYLSGRFAAKEAYAKARGTGIGKLSWQHIEVKSVAGKPIIASPPTEKVHVTITHTRSMAAAQVIIESMSS